MTPISDPPLVIGELFVDFSIPGQGAENKLRLGGIAHAARGFWALGMPFAVAAIVPHYLTESARSYLTEFGCTEFVVLGEVVGAPNVIAIFDSTEVADQGYEDLLREEKSIMLNDAKESLSKYNDILIFPGSYDLETVCNFLSLEAKLHLDIAYGVDKVDDLLNIKQAIDTILISTSSQLFSIIGTRGIDELSRCFEKLDLESLVLKENRGGSRIRVFTSGHTEHVPAQLGKTVNSVGVGDVFAAVYVALRSLGLPQAAWSAARASSAYAQTTEPDIFRSYVGRELKLSLEQMKSLGGTFLPWESRQNISIYLAAPDFDDVDRDAIDRAISSLQYHNFRLRRPIAEHGELAPDSGLAELCITYQDDLSLLRECQLVFAIPIGRDPGTLVEIGLANQLNIPVIVFDPKRECANTLVIAGSHCYSQFLDDCLNATFTALGRMVSPCYV